MIRLLSILLLAGLPAYAFAGPDARDLFGVEVGGGSHLVYTGSFEAFSRSPAMGTFHLGGNWVPSGFGRQLALDARVARSGSFARNFNAFDARLSVTHLSAGAAWRQPLYDRVYAVGRAGAGAEWVRARLDDGRAVPFVGGAWAAVLEGTAGVEVISPTFAAGPVERHVVVRLEGGFGWRPFGAHLGRVERRPDDGDPPRVQQVAMDLGTLYYSGWVVRGAAGYRF